MKLTLALDMTAPCARPSSTKMPEKAQDSAIPAEFSSLLDGESEAVIALVGEMAGEMTGELPAVPGKPLPPETGKILPPGGEAHAAAVPVATVDTGESTAETPSDAEMPRPVRRFDGAGIPQATRPGRSLSAAEVPCPRDAVAQQAATPDARPAPAVDGKPQPLRVELKADALPTQPAIVPVAPSPREGVLQFMQASQQPRAARKAVSPDSEAQVEAVAAARPDLVQSARRERGQGAPQPFLRETHAEVGPREGAPSASRTSAAAPATPAPHIPAQPAPQLAEAPQPQPVATTGERLVMAPQQAERHDFSAVVERLAQAREMAQPGRADMQMMHREFGNISVQFEMAGQSLKVALASSDAGFAPAVQAALADRPIMPVSESQRADAQMARSDSQQSTGGNGQHGQPSAQAQSQNPADGNSRGAPQRQHPEQSQPRQQAGGEGATARSTRNARDNGLFA